MLKPLSDLMVFVLNYFYDLTSSYGISIILLTLVIKFILFPLMHTQTKSMGAMQAIQPKIKGLQEKYKSDPKKLNQEMAKLYKENKVNPAAGCLPLLIQLPFLFALFKVLQTYSYDIDKAGFLWLSNLGNPDPYYILPVLVGVTTYLQQKLTPGANQGGQSQKTMLMMMPLLIGFMSMRFPAGLSLYWAVSNLFTIVQTYLMVKKSPTAAKEE